MCPGKKDRALLRVYSQIWLFLTSLDGKNISGETKTPKTLEAETITLLSSWFIVFSLPRSKQEHPVIQYLHRQHIKSKQRYFHPIYFFISTNKSIWNNFMHRTQLMFRSKRAKINIHFTLEPEHHTPDVCSVCVNMSRVMEMYQAGVDNYQS